MRLPSWLPSPRRFSSPATHACVHPYHQQRHLLTRVRARPLAVSVPCCRHSFVSNQRILQLHSILPLLPAPPDMLSLLAMCLAPEARQGMHRTRQSACLPPCSSMHMILFFCLARACQRRHTDRHLVDGRVERQASLRLNRKTKRHTWFGTCDMPDIRSKFRPRWSTCQPRKRLARD
jgi:hypothetical protein